MEQGNWQTAHPLFLAAQDVTRLQAWGGSEDPAPASAVGIVYFARDGSREEASLYILQYHDASGVRRINEPFVAEAGREDRFAVTFDPETAGLAQTVADASGEELARATHTLGTEEGDGFAFDKVGVATDADVHDSEEPPIVAWVDDIPIAWHQPPEPCQGVLGIGPCLPEVACEPSLGPRPCGGLL